MIDTALVVLFVSFVILYFVLGLTVNCNCCDKKILTCRKEGPGLGI